MAACRAKTSSVKRLCPVGLRDLATGGSLLAGVAVQSGWSVRATTVPPPAPNPTARTVLVPHLRDLPGAHRRRTFRSPGCLWERAPRRVPGQRRDPGDAQTSSRASRRADPAAPPQRHQAVRRPAPPAGSAGSSACSSPSEVEADAEQVRSLAGAARLAAEASERRGYRTLCPERTSLRPGFQGHAPAAARSAEGGQAGRAAIAASLPTPELRCPS